jgi:hypothetical protein
MSTLLLEAPVEQKQEEQEPKASLAITVNIPYSLISTPMAYNTFMQQYSVFVGDGWKSSPVSSYPDYPSSSYCPVCGGPCVSKMSSAPYSREYPQSAPTQQPYCFVEDDLVDYLDARGDDEGIGIPGDSYECIVARAMRQKYPEARSVQVGGYGASINSRLVSFPSRVSQAIRVFDGTFSHSGPVTKREFLIAWERTGNAPFATKKRVVEAGSTTLSTLRESLPVGV